MSNLLGKRIVIGITGGIAAYKSIELIRLLRKANAEVRVVLTPAAADFTLALECPAVVVIRGQAGQCRNLMAVKFT